MNYFIAYDLGTGGIKASIFNADGVSKYDAFKQYETFFPCEKFCEQRPADWWNGVCEVTQELFRQSSLSKDDISGVALSGHSQVAVPFDKDNKTLLDQVPIWCDTRARDQVDSFFENLSYDHWYSTTGNGDPPECYTILKLMWFRQHMPEMFNKIKIFVGSKDFINYKLTGNFVTDPSYASSFGVFNLYKWRYEPEFFEAAGISPDIFPPVSPSDSIIGQVTDEAAARTGLRAGTPVACGAVDNTCMALGARGVKEGSIYTSLGSSSWIAVTSQKPIIDIKTKPFVFAHVKEGLYTSAVSIFSAGNSFRWVRDNLCRDLPDDTTAYDMMNAMAEQIPVGSNGVFFNPTLAGGSAQEASPDLKGSFLGLTLRNTREDLVRASMEGIAMALRQVLDILKTQTTVSGEMLLCGGGSKSAIWRNIFSNVYNMPILKTNIDQNAASLGAASMAANAVGVWNGYDMIPRIHQTEDLIYPDSTQSAEYEKLFSIYKDWTASLAVICDKASKITP